MISFLLCQGQVFLRRNKIKYFCSNLIDRLKYVASFSSLKAVLLDIIMSGSEEDNLFIIRFNNYGIIEQKLK